MSLTASTVTVRAAESRELPRCALLLAQSMYPVELPRGQANELTRLELKDLEARYGALVGKRKYPSRFFVAEEDQEFLGAGESYHINPPYKNTHSRIFE